LDALSISSEDWFIRSGARGRELSGGRFVPGFVCKPLTAKHTFKGHFLHGAPTILMSATFGNFDTFAEELGIDDWQSLCVPSVWPPESRPVYYFDDCPKIGYNSSYADLEKQASLIAKAIKTVPDNWRGVIHCTSYQQVKSMATRLEKCGLGHRLWVPGSTGTDKQMAEWQKVEKEMRGALAVTCTWWEGVDLNARIVINGKCPYPFIGDSYSKARLKYNGKFYLQRTAWRLQQGSGRTRRGRVEDYDSDGNKSGLVIIADSNWKRVNKYFDKDFRLSLKPWDLTN
jgi:Rad3-related DNA helicase